MRAVQQVVGKVVELSEGTSVGWLPSNAAPPQPTRPKRLLLDICILEGDGEYILEWHSANGDFSNDSWHATIEDAKREAMDQFGIEASEWREID